MGPGQDLAPLSAMACEVVESATGEKIGCIKDFMVDLQDGAIAYVVLSCGGLFGIGARLIAVPWSLLQRDGNRYILHIDSNILQQIPGVDEDGVVRALDAARLRHVQARPVPEART